MTKQVRQKLKHMQKKTGQAVSGYQKGGVVDMKNPMMPDDMQGFAGGGMVNAMNRSQNIQGYGYGGMVMKKKKK